MPADIGLVLEDPVVMMALSQAWADSNPGIVGAHEEGGYIVRVSTGQFDVLRWPQGRHDAIELPPHTDCQVDGAPIVASFHTHPNLGHEYVQEPSETDRRAVRDDPDLKGSEYAGELVITMTTVYLISPLGQVREVGRTSDLLHDM